MYKIIHTIHTQAILAAKLINQLWSTMNHLIDHDQKWMIIGQLRLSVIGCPSVDHLKINQRAWSSEIEQAQVRAGSSAIKYCKVTLSMVK